MKNLLKKQNHGFTIIEVMIVLAIAGLIMVIVFIAVPQLQRNQRDNARQNAVNRLHAELDTYAGNNSGRYPFNSVGTGTGTISDFNTRYIGTTAPYKVKMENPKTGVQYTLVFAANDSSDPTADQILIHRDASCSGENAVGTTSSASSRQYALRVQLDRTTTIYCVDNGN